MRTPKLTLTFAIAIGVALFAACGFECTIDGEKQQFASCDDLQTQFDAEQSRQDPPPNGAALNDMQTCGEVYGCEVAP